MIGMIWRLSFVLLLGVIAEAHSQVAPVDESVSVTISGDRTEVRADSGGLLHVHVSPADAAVIESPLPAVGSCLVADRDGGIRIACPSPVAAP